MSFIRKRLKKNQKGVATIEFLGMVPFVFLLLVILWQFFAAGYAVMTAQSAANEAAKVYSTSADEGKAMQSAREIVQATGSSISYDTGTSHVSATSNRGTFKASVGVNLDLVFLPKSWHLPKIPIHQGVTSRVIE